MTARAPPQSEVGVGEGIARAARPVRSSLRCALARAPGDQCEQRLLGITVRPRWQVRDRGAEGEVSVFLAERCLHRTEGLSASGLLARPEEKGLHDGFHRNERFQAGLLEELGEMKPPVSHV